MRHIGGISASAIALLAFAAPAAAQSSINEATDAGRPQIIRSENLEPNAEVVMTGQSFQIAKGETAKGFMLLAGTRADIVLRNEDTVAHEFVSPMLFNVPRIDAETVGRIGVDHRRSAPELELHLGEQGGHELMRQRILIAQLQRDLLSRRQGEGRVLRLLPGGISLDHMEGLLLDDENHVGLILTLIALSKSAA